MTRITRIFLFLSLCLAMVDSTASAQQDTSMYVTIGGVFEDGFNSVVLDNDSNLVFCGYTSSQGGFGTKGFIVKTDSLLNILWSSTYAESSTASFSDVVLNEEGYLAIGKILNASSSYDILVAQFSENGDLLWDKHLGGDDWDFGNSISAITGGFLISGETYSYSENSDAYACKIDGLGSVIWEKIFSTDSHEMFSDGRESGNGSLLFGGEKKIDNEFSVQWFVLADSDGEIILERENGAEGKNALHAVLADPIDETYFAFGEIYNTDSELTNGTITRLDETGEVMWRDTLANSTGTHKWINAEIGRSNEIICTGTILDVGFGNQGTDFFIKRITRTNLFVGQNTYGTNNDDDPAFGIRIPNGYIIAGKTDGLGQGQFDGFIVRTRNSGLDSDYSTSEYLDSNSDFFQGVEDISEKSLRYTFNSDTKELSFSDEITEYKILDSTGRLIISSDVNPSNVFLNFSPGIYLIQLNGDSGLAGKVLIQ